MFSSQVQKAISGAICGGYSAARAGSRSSTFARVNAGTVAGLVTDASGGTVEGAAITLTDKSTSTARTTTSNEAGRYLLANVPPGTYEITANKSGFNLARVREVNVVVGTPLNIDFKLELGSMSQTVEVSTTGADLQTSNSTIGTSIV